MYAEVKAGKATLWVAVVEGVICGAVITNIVAYPQCSFLNMAFCGGDAVKKWKDPMLQLLQRFAREHGCQGIESSGRPGWAKVFKDNGYKANWVTYELPI
jgi:hypothetical protein